MNEYDYNVFFVSPLGIDDVVKPGEGIYAPGKDDLDPDRSTLKALRQGMRKHWSNPGESSLLSAYQEEHIAYEIAHQYLRQGKQATVVVISVLLAVRKESVGSCGSHLRIQSTYDATGRTQSLADGGGILGSGCDGSYGKY
ncbi:hypothetical protein MY4824_006357 [Beauveria thailandica]